MCYQGRVPLSKYFRIKMCTSTLLDDKNVKRNERLSQIFYRCFSIEDRYSEFVARSQHSDNVHPQRAAK